MHTHTWEEETTCFVAHIFAVKWHDLNIFVLCKQINMYSHLISSLTHFIFTSTDLFNKSHVSGLHQIFKIIWSGRIVLKTGISMLKFAHFCMTFQRIIFVINICTEKLQSNPPGEVHRTVNFRFVSFWIWCVHWNNELYFSMRMAHDILKCIVIVTLVVQTSIFNVKTMPSLRIPWESVVAHDKVVRTHLFWRQQWRQQKQGNKKKRLYKAK